MTRVEPHLTAAEAAERLTQLGVPVAEDTIRRWARAGRLLAIELPSGRLRFRREDIDALAAVERIEAASS